MVGGTLYVNSPTSVGAAVDAKTGARAVGLQPEELRVGHDHDERALEPARRRPTGPTAPTSASTGAPATAISSRWTRRPAGRSRRSATNGRVDLMDGLPRAKRGERDYLNALTYSVQSPPFVVRDVIITPASISSLVIRQGADSRMDPRLRRPHRQGALDLQDRARAGRVRQRHVGDRLLVVRRQGHGVVDDERRRGAGLRLSAHEHRRARLLRRPPARQQPVCREHPVPRPRDRPARVALPDRPPWPVGLRQPGRAQSASTSRSTARGSRRWRRSPSRASSTPSIARPACRSGRSKSGPCRRPTSRASRASPTQPFPTRPAAFEYQGVTDRRSRRLHARDPRDGASKAIEPFKIGPLFTPPSLQGTIMRPGATGRRRTGPARRSIPTPGCSTCRPEQGWPSSGWRAPEAGAGGNLQFMQAHAAQSADARRAAAVQAAVLAHDRDQHEHRRARLDDAGRQRRPHPQPAAAEAAQSAAGRRRHTLCGTRADEDAARSMR